MGLVGALHRVGPIALLGRVIYGVSTGSMGHPEIEEDVGKVTIPETIEGRACGKGSGSYPEWNPGEIVR